MSADLAAKIESYVNPDGSVIVTPAAARWIKDRIGLTLDQRLLARDRGDLEVYAVLSALHMSAVDGDALAARSANGPKGAKPQGHQQDSDWLTATEAATVAGVDPRTIRKWAKAGRLPADLHGRSWRINRTHLHIAQALARLTRPKGPHANVSHLR